MKVMTAMYTMRRGGSYDRFLMMIRALLERGVEVHCLSLSPVPVVHPLFNSHHVVYLKDKPGSLLTKALVFLSFPWMALFIAWRQRIDVLIAFGVIYAFIFALAKLLLRKPIVTFVRGDLSSSLQNGLPGYFSQWVIRRISQVGLRASNRIAVVNQEIREDVSRALGADHQDRLVLLPNNISVLDLKTPDRSEIRRRYGVPKEAKLIVTGGTLTPIKNVELLIEALKIIDNPNLYLIVTGEGPSRQHLEGLAKTLGLEKRVFFAGWRSQEELWALFRACDLFVLSSRNEGMPNVMLEALGLGLPCIGSRVPGVVDILEDDNFLFEAWDEKSLARKVDHLFSDSQAYLSLKRACQEKAKQFIFDWDEKVFQIVTQGICYQR